ncbi:MULTISPECIES: hypothetical protein [unclassified Aeromicrobium]|uniref:hypothetical protein n=1 Tax=unclassified Aeromicrobium TaxID=2633570 RepID=UPI002097B2B4|nr:MULTISPECIES: hypothetical protein [unclassified Aeromicrobium]MCO7237741.1 hypothetical protein [Aeromicrobium sp. CnD17-E]MDR6117701.1 hypothetical protein [Aeromicrobium sp. SORGH_AS_0981]
MRIRTFFNPVMPCWTSAFWHRGWWSWLRAARRGLWSSGSTLTDAHIARTDGKYFVAQFDRGSGDLVTAFVPKNDQRSAMLRLLGQ